MTWIKRVVVVLAVGFCLFYLIKQPEGSADAVRNVVLAAGHALRSVFTFVRSLALS